MAPRGLAPPLHSLPPILHILTLDPLQSYSKGAQGLSVLPRVPGIFTESAISLSPWLRQWGDRYAIRAGRNLPDKEFRYLRTVIVTAAVYRGFGSELAPLPLTFRHRAGVRPYTSSCDLAESCVFDKQSLPPFHCDPFRLHPQGFHRNGYTFFRSYGVNLQSSLTRVLSSALVYSTRLPESVCGTVTYSTRYEVFLGSVGSVTLCPEGLVITSRR